MKRYKSGLTGHLDIFVAKNEEESKGEITKWENVLIHGDPEGSVAIIIGRLDAKGTGQFYDRYISKD